MAALERRVVAAWIGGVYAVTVASVRSIGVDGVARLLKSMDGVDVVSALPLIPARIRLHSIAIPHALWWSTYGTSLAVAVVAALATTLIVAVIACAREAVLFVAASAMTIATIVAAPPAVVAAHDIGLVGTHRLRPAAVLAIDSSLKGTNGVKRALPSRASWVG